MKPGSMAAVVALSFALAFWSIPGAFGSGNGGGGGGGGGGAPSGGGHGGHASSGAAMPAPAGPAAAHGSVGSGMKGYSGGGLGRGNHYPIYGSTAVRSSNVHARRSSNVYSTAGQGQVTSSAGTHSGQNPSGLTRTHRSANKSSLTNTSTITTHDGKTRAGKWARNDKANRGRFDSQTQQTLRNGSGHSSSLAEAKNRHHETCGDGDHHGHHGHHHHDNDWWKHHCNAIILVDGGFWGWWDGWWYPAWGYDDYYSYYAYDGPVYCYDGLPPDEVVANVQGELQRLGYYRYAVDGVLGRRTREALTRYQRDQRLPITGAIDPNTIGALGLGS